jgi:hypothetical protein
VREREREREREKERDRAERWLSERAYIKEGRLGGWMAGEGEKKERKREREKESRKGKVRRRERVRGLCARVCVRVTGKRDRAGRRGNTRSIIL